LKIDAYTHCGGKNYLDKIIGLSSPEIRKEATRIQKLIAEHPQFLKIEPRLKDMDKYGIDMQVTMLHMPIEPNRFEFEEESQRVELCKVANDDMAEIPLKSKGRIVSLGVAPLHDSATCKEEMTRAVKDLGLKGFMAPTQSLGTPIDKFSHFWEQAEKLDVAVYIHPVDPYVTTGRPYENEYDLAHVFGWPFETSLTFSRLIFSGVMNKHPRLRVLSHHLGGMIPFLAGRIDESYDYTASLVNPESKANRLLKGRAIDFFRQFYYDTAVGGNPAAIKCGLEVFGAERIVFSTDYPWGPKGGRQRLERYPAIMQALRLSAKEKKVILEENARKLLKIE
jgi:predicted TIM-barrel fold metal-dependent hydrolase